MYLSVIVDQIVIAIPFESYIVSDTVKYIFCVLANSNFNLYDEVTGRVVIGSNGNSRTKIIKT